MHLTQQTPLQSQVHRSTRKVLMRIGSTQDYIVLEDKKMAGLSFQKDGCIRALRENYQSFQLHPPTSPAFTCAELQRNDFFFFLG